MWAYIFAAAVLPAMILGYPIIECGDGLPTPRELRIEGCTASPCNVTRGTIINFEADLTANAVSGVLRLVIDMTALGETIEFPLPPPLTDVCDWLTVGSCPVQPGDLITQTSVLPVIVDFQGGIPVLLRSRIYNDDGTTLSCSIINARVY